MKTIRRVSLIAFLLFLGILIILVMRGYMKMQIEGILIGILFAPLLAYAILYGSLRELGVGGLKAKFGEVANETIQPDFGQIGPSLADMQTVGEEGIAALEDMLAHYRLSESIPIVIIIKLGRGDYPREETLGFINKLSQYQSFKLVIFLDRADKVIAYMPPWAMRQILSQSELGNAFLSIVNQDGNYIELLSYPHVFRETIAIEDNNAMALQKMAEHNLDAMVVVNTDNSLKGVVERGRVISRIMLKMVEK